LLVEGVVLRSEEGRILFDGLDWSLARGARVRVRAPFAGDAAPLLRLAAGLAHPQAGSVRLDGTPLGPYAFDHPFLRRGALGWVPREGGLLVNQTLLANASLPLRFTKGARRAAAEARAAEALEAAGLAAVADHRPHALEPRERWLGALVRAALMEPELWLVDLPRGELPEAARVILDRAAASSAALVVTGGESWNPGESTQALGWVDGRLVPEEG
jgi:predicted ABC-type transport system involved in lysophospholipase L1 biosynthesis ATPase subunit